MGANKPHAYTVRGNFAFGSTESPEFKKGYQFGSQLAQQNGADPKTAHALGLNNAEHALQDAGYDGYESPAHPGVRFHFGDHDAEPVQTHQHKTASALRTPEGRIGVGCLRLAQLPRPYVTLLGPTFWVTLSCVSGSVTPGVCANGADQ